LRWLGIKVAADPEMTPRQRLTTAPYSFNALTGLGAKIVNVTVQQNSTRTLLPTSSSIIMESFIVDKKSSSSLLLIQGTISGFGAYSGAMTQGWKYGNSAEVIAQGLTYTTTPSPYSLVFQTSAIISGHLTTGPQILVFRYFAQDGSSGNKPFNVYNPNAADETRLAQTRSVYTVWEIEQ
jgi:hypothetical protein